VLQLFDFAEKPVVDFEALRQGGFQAKQGFFGRIKSLQHFRFSRVRKSSGGFNHLPVVGVCSLSFAVRLPKSVL